jgi:hypothetical protein
MTPEELREAELAKVNQMTGQQPMTAINPDAAGDQGNGANPDAAADASNQGNPDAAADAQAADQQAQQQQAGPQSLTVEDLAAGKFKLPEEIEERLKLAERLIKNPNSAKVLDIYERNPQDVRQVLDLAATDFDGMTPKQVLKHQFAEKHPDLVDDDRAFDEYLSREISGYNPDNEDLTDSKLAKKELDGKISSWKDEQNGKKSNFEALFKKEEANQQTGPTPEAIAAENTRRRGEVSQLKSIPIELAEGLVIDLPIGDEERALLEKAVEDPSAFLAAKYMSEDSSGNKKFNAAQFAKDLAILMNPKGIAMKAAALGMDAQNGQNMEAFNAAMGRGQMKKPGDVASSEEQPAAKSLRDQHQALVDQLAGGNR